MAPTYAALRDEYARLWDGMTIDKGRLPTLDKAARTMLANRGRYEAVARDTGVPWAFIAVLHWREASGSFAGVLHNGEKILGTGRKTKLVPAGRGPFATWEDAARDALRLKSLHKITDWSVERCLFEGERFNGFGYRNRKVPSAYLWSFTNVYTGGKYIVDGVWSATAKDKQPGIAPLMLRIMALDPSVTLVSSKTAPSKSAASAKPAVQPKIGSGTYNSPGLKTVQELLRSKGYAEVGIPDGDWGIKTESALRAFQSENALPVTGSYDMETAAALPAAPARAVGATRANITASDLRAAGSEAARGSWRSKMGAAIIGAPAGAIGLVQGAAAYIGDATGYIATLKSLVDDVPGFVWAGAVCVIAVAIYLQSRRAENAKVVAVRTGVDAGPV